MVRQKQRSVVERPERRLYIPYICGYPTFGGISSGDGRYAAL